MLHQVLWNLALEQRRESGGFEQDLRKLAQTAAHAVGVSRASIWAFRRKGASLECLTQYDAHGDAFMNQPPLERSRYPAYFTTLLEQRFIDASDAANDPRTCEFAADYLSTSHITSMLDIAIFQGSRPTGLICLEHQGTPRHWSDEEKAFATSLADLTGLLLSDRERRESAAVIESGMENACQAVLICDAAGRLRRVNGMAQRVFGYKQVELLRMAMEQLIPAFEAHTVTDSSIEGGLLTGAGCRRDGSRFPVEYSISHIQHWGEPLVMIILSDISERHARAQQLQRSENLYRGLVEDHNDFIFRSLPGGRLIFANNAMCRGLGLDPDRVGEHQIYDFMPSPDRESVRAAAYTLTPERPVTQYQQALVLQDGEQRTFNWMIRAFFDDDRLITSFQAIGRDMTEALRQQEVMKESQRLEGLALLAGGMAHDFNNLLTPILSFTDLAQTSLPRDRPELQYLEFVMKSALRARDLIRMVLIFSKREEGKSRRPVAAGSLLREIASFIRTTTPSHVRFIDQVDIDCGVIRASPSDLFQILSNLCTNGIQAMPAGGSLTLNATRVAHRDRQMLQLEIMDTGSGIEARDMDRIFFPFFTTKPVGEGTGLGLSVVRSLVEELGGEIFVKSLPGEGTAFVLYFPLVEEEPEAAPKSVTHSLLAGTEHILVVDDEPHVASALRASLEQLGYTVTVRSSPNEALTTFRRNPSRFDAMITDYTMPFMTGVELSWRVRRQRQDMPIILMSGYGQLLGETEIRAIGIDLFLSKPFVIAELAGSLRQLLGPVSTI